MPRAGRDQEGDTMDYQTLYQEKLTTAGQAVKTVQSGDWVDYGWCTNYPVALDLSLIHI